MNRSIALPEVGPSRAMYLTHNIKKLLVKSGHIKKTDPSGHASLSTPTDKSHSSRRRLGYLLLILYSYSSFYTIVGKWQKLDRDFSDLFVISGAEKFPAADGIIPLPCMRPNAKISPPTNAPNGFDAFHALYIGFGTGVGIIEVQGFGIYYHVQRVQDGE